MTHSKSKLVYVPSDVMLCKFDLNGRYISEYFKIKQPLHLLVTENLDDLYEVLHENERWTVKKSEVYEVHDD